MPIVVRLGDVGAENTLKNCAHLQLTYTEPMPVGEWSGTGTHIGIVLVPSRMNRESRLSYVCLASKGKRIATRFAQAKLTHILPLHSLELSAWLTAVPKQFQAPLRSAIEVTGKPIPPATWDVAREALIKLRPEVAEHLAQLEILLNPDLHLTPHEQDVLGQQKDAVGVALDAAGLHRQAIRYWRPQPRHAPWLSGITPGPIREDTMVIHDASRAPGWAPVGEPYVGIVEFIDRADNRLTVMNVNRHPIEKITGVDLLYYRHEPASFALVQYKRLTSDRPTSKESDAPDPTFRPSSDRGFEDELRRMHIVEELASGQRTANTKSIGVPTEYDPILNYRLHPRSCWIKLCEPEGFHPTGSDLVKGMYLPLDLFEELNNNAATLGPRGGRVFSYDHVPRWINNTLFTELMGGGWIGSRTMQTAWLSDTVEAALSARRSVVIAEEKRQPRRGRRIS